MIEPGMYNAKILNYGVKQTKSGDAAPTIKFAVGSNPVFWQGSWKEGKPREISLEALITCGFKKESVRDLYKFADGLDSGLLDISKEVNVTVEHETFDGKTYPRVSWINQAGAAGKFKNAIDSGTTKMLIKGMGIEADMMAMYQSIAEPVKAVAAASEDIPF